MIIKNATVYDSSFEAKKTDIKVENGVITELGENLRGDGELDFSGLTVYPGFIDIHMHGGNMADTSDGTAEAIQTLSTYLADRGITSFCPATMTLPEERIAASFRAVNACMGKEKGAYIHGMNLEGPFISMTCKGAQPGEYVRKPDIAEFERLSALCKVSLVDIAPEEDDGFRFSETVSKRCTVSAAHTCGSYETVTESFAHGVSHTTHLFNGMQPIVNRNPGAVMAVLDNNHVTAELICDGKHIHASILRLAFKTLGESRTVIVSDSMMAAGCGDGEYMLGGQTVYVRGGTATLADGTFAASTANIFDEFKIMLSIGIPFRQALKSCTINPARVIKADAEVGSIAVGKAADLTVVDGDINLKAVFIKGKRYK